MSTQQGSSLREQYAGAPAAHAAARGTTKLDAETPSNSSMGPASSILVPTCSFSDSEAGHLTEDSGFSAQRSSVELAQHHHHAGQHHQQQQQPAASHTPGVAAADRKQPQHQQLQQQQQRQAPQQLQQRHPLAPPPPPPAGPPPPPSQQQQQQQQAPATQQHEEPSKADAARPARLIKPHLDRADVTRGILHHVAKAFGIHLKGDVATNEISTAKYTLLTFLPVNLFEQFLRVANLYFLLMVILQLIPGLSPTALFTTVAPLVFVLAVNAIKEGYDDVQRHRNDNQVNNRLVLLLSKARGEHEVFWKNVVAGDLIKVRANEEVPADLVLLSTADPEHLCYVETANLDGETNLKIKQCWGGYVNSKSVQDFEPFVTTCKVGCEPPNPRLYVFDGYMEVTERSKESLAEPQQQQHHHHHLGFRRTGSHRRTNSFKAADGPKHKEPLDINNLLLRGSVLRKTDWVIGVAVNVGSDSKIVQNMTKAPRKVTQLERAMNVLVFVQFTALLVFSAVLAGLDQYWTIRNIPAAWYIQAINKWPEVPPSAFGWFVSFLRFIILLSNMIPISLYVSLEVVKVFQCALLFNQDRDMYHAETDTPFVCRTTTLNEELGQVQYVLSDKTGTLTQNVMGFVWASVGGKLYGKAASEDNKPAHVPANTPHSIALDADMQEAAGMEATGKQAVKALKEVDRFLLNLAVCNTVCPTVDSAGNLVYQAASPDEEALVQGAAYLGYKLKSRTTDRVEVDIDGFTHTFDVLATLEFNSDRKRMSIIVRTPENRVMLMCKGADSIILKRLAPGDPGVHAATQHLDEMARGGYRTLLIAEREISTQEYDTWQKAYANATVALENREQLMSVEQSKIEESLRLVGATAVEDKLQDGVPECLQALGTAGIKVWVLTGDKVETAISIAFSCKLFTEDMQILEMREEEFQAAITNAARDARANTAGAAKANAAQAAKTNAANAAKTTAAVIQVLEAKMRAVHDLNAQMGIEAPRTNVGIVIEGGALHAALDKGPAEDALMELCKGCKAVVCCRVTPMQKAEITYMVKKKAGAITLGIGDGANDVGMIRAAHIGVGISGREGRAAVLASDFSFAQFRYLSRLLLLHGRWSYMRNKEVVLYSFYKNWAYVLVYVYLQFVAGFSAIPIFTTMMISTFNMIFTACPIVAYAVLEKDLDKSTVLAHPQTYTMTRTATRARFFWDFFCYVYVVGTWHSLPVYFLPWYSLDTPDRTGLHGDLSALGTAVFIALTFCVTLKLSLRTHCWSWITHLVYWLSVALLFPFVYTISILWATTNISGVADMSGVGEWLFRNAVFWLTALSGACAIALLPDIAWMLFSRYFKPTIATLLQEKELQEAVSAEVNARQPVAPATPFNAQRPPSPRKASASFAGIPCFRHSPTKGGSSFVQVAPADRQHA